MPYQAPGQLRRSPRHNVARRRAHAVPRAYVRRRCAVRRSRARHRPARSPPAPDHRARSRARRPHDAMRWPGSARCPERAVIGGLPIARCKDRQALLMEQVDATVEYGNDRLAMRDSQGAPGQRLPYPPDLRLLARDRLRLAFGLSDDDWRNRRARGRQAQ